MANKRYQAYSIRFTPEELEGLRAVAERENLPISEVIREALAAYRHARLGIVRTRIEAAGTRFTLEVAEGDSSRTEAETARTEARTPAKPSAAYNTTTEGAMLAPA